MTAGTERSEAAFVRAALSGTRLATVRWVEETGSTNDDLVAIAKAGGPEQVLITDLQTAGKGRRGRVWDAPPRSSILMSVLIRGRSPAEGFWSVGAVALGASQAIDAITTSRCSLKWPNDVLLGGVGDGDERAPKKVAGVLAQLVDDAVIVGIGINVNWPDDVPAAMSERGTAVNLHAGQSADSVASIDRATLAADILRRAMCHLEAAPDTLRSDWKQQCSTLNRHVRVEREPGPVEGIAVDITPDGALVVETDGEQSTHHVGDVVHLRPI